MREAASCNCDCWCLWLLLHPTRRLTSETVLCLSHEYWGLSQYSKRRRGWAAGSGKSRTTVTSTTALLPLNENTRAHIPGLDKSTWHVGPVKSTGSCWERFRMWSVRGWSLPCFLQQWNILLHNCSWQPGPLSDEDCAADISQWGTPGVNHSVQIQEPGRLWLQRVVHTEAVRVKNGAVNCWPVGSHMSRTEKQQFEE